MSGISLKLERSTIYIDLAGLPDPVNLGISARCFNQTGGSLSFSINAVAPGWTFGSRSIGSISAGYNHRYNQHNFGYRAKPLVEVTETITVTLTAGSHTDIKEITLHFIDSEDGSWTTDESDNFNDGTKQGWTHKTGSGKSSWMDGTYVMSSPYALRGTCYGTVLSSYMSIELYKSFNTPDKNEVFAIIYARARNQNTLFFQLDFEDTHLGWITGQYPAPTDRGASPPADIWMKIVVPLTRNAVVEVNVEGTFEIHNMFGSWGHLYIDDFKIISRD